MPPIPTHVGYNTRITWDTSKPKPTAVGAYIFAGGFTLGMQQYLDVLCHLEETPYGVETASHNLRRPDGSPLSIHIGTEHWPIRELRRRGVDVVYGNPPCAAWSPAGSRKGQQAISRWVDDPRVHCTRRHLTLVDSLEPLVWVWESVTQAYTKGWAFVREVTQGLMERDYHVTHVLHDAQWLGVPQVRPRFFCVAHKVPLAWKLPTFETPLTAAQALAQVRPHKNDEAHSRVSDSPQKSQQVIEELGEGESAIRAWERIMHRSGPPETWPRSKQGLKGRPPFGVRRLREDRPAFTISGYSVVHPVEDRCITLREAQHLCGYPEGFVLQQGNPEARQRQLARGVLPPVAAWLARAINKGIVQHRQQQGTMVGCTLLDIRRPPGFYQDTTQEVAHATDTNF